MINPAWLLPLTLLFCSLLSLVTGTSYGSVGSAGVAMMAIGNAMGINPGMVAGAVICGAMFGDKLSPLSDTTNLAPAVAGAKLGDHIRSMLWTTLPTYVITLIIFTVLGFSQTAGDYTTGNISTYVDALNNEFHLGFFTMIPAILIIVLLLCKVNAISALGISSFAAGFVSFFVQHDTLQSIIRTAYNGYSTAIEEPVLQSILNRGGMGSMLQYVAIICFAVGMGGMLEKLGVLDHILSNRKAYQQRRKHDLRHLNHRIYYQLNQLFPAYGTCTDRTSDGSDLQRAQGCAGDSFPVSRRFRNTGRSYDPVAWLRCLHGRYFRCCMGSLLPLPVPALPDPNFQYFLWLHRNLYQAMWMIPQPQNNFSIWQKPVLVRSDR